jgi:hypothetical protein
MAYGSETRFGEVKEALIASFIKLKIFMAVLKSAVKVCEKAKDT